MPDALDTLHALARLEASYCTNAILVLSRGGYWNLNVNSAAARILRAVRPMEN